MYVYIYVCMYIYIYSPAPLASGWPDKQGKNAKTHYILGVAWGCSFPRVNIAFHAAFHANFTGTSRYFTLRIFGGLSGPPVAKLSSRFLWALIHIYIYISYQSVTWASGSGKFPNRLRSHVLSVNSDSKNANTCKYGSLICFLSGNSILVGSCRFQIQFQGPLHVGKLEWWIYVWWFCTSLRFQGP